MEKLHLTLGLLIYVVTAVLFAFISGATSTLVIFYLIKHFTL